MARGQATFLSILFAIILLIGASCQPVLHSGETIQLAEAEENFVKVSIFLTVKENDAVLSATFTPQEPNLHLYSKDIPKTGIDGLGRPTLLELSPDSLIKTLSALKADAELQTPPTPPFELLTYPAGSVTLSLQIEIPESGVKEDIFVTYMACDERGCRAPIQYKPIKISIPNK